MKISNIEIFYMQDDVYFVLDSDYEKFMEATKKEHIRVRGVELCRDSIDANMRVLNFRRIVLDGLEFNDIKKVSD